ncbi:MAG TPA: nuclear transport factor 2 family protein [Acidimicrobiia bacterium]|nr:nuclear transport factor 2 family protein [Acidimicrobiia bacterium]
MPWFPDFANAAELARREDRAVGQADPIVPYFRALNEGDPRPLENVWPGEVLIHDPRAGEVRGHRQLRHFVKRNLSWLAGYHARIETTGSTKVGRTAVMELLAHMDVDGREVAWPVAVVAESPDDLSVVFRTYLTQWPILGTYHVRASFLDPAPAPPGDVVGRYYAAVGAGDVDAVVGTFSPDGYFREPVGPDAVHRGQSELRSYFAGSFSAGGGIGLQPCIVTDDGVHCAVEHNCVRWGDHELPSQAGIGIYERNPDGLLSAARVYDDVEPPVQRR